MAPSTIAKAPVPIVMLRSGLSGDICRAPIISLGTGRPE
jgi:hypothetical protein